MPRLHIFGYAFFYLTSLVSFLSAAAKSESTIGARDPIPAGYVAAPYYPTPNGGWISSWSASYAKAAAVVGNMTLAEKVNITSGTGYFMVWTLVCKSSTRIL